MKKHGRRYLQADRLPRNLQLVGCVMEDLFFNVRIGSDVKSYKLISLDKSGRRGVVQEVKRSIPKGLLRWEGMTCVNQHEQENIKAIKAVGGLIDIVKRGGNFYVSALSVTPIFGVSKERRDSMPTGITTLEDGQKVDYQWRLETDGTFSCFIYDLTMAGKIKKRYDKIGLPEKTCHYFYDYNF